MFWLIIYKQGVVAQKSIHNILYRMGKSFNCKLKTIQRSNSNPKAKTQRFQFNMFCFCQQRWLKGREALFLLNATQQPAPCRESALKLLPRLLAHGNKMIVNILETFLASRKQLLRPLEMLRTCANEVPLWDIENR